MKHRKFLVIFFLISMTMSLLIYLHTEALESLAWRLFRNNLEWRSYQQQNFVKTESGKCTLKSKVFVKLQDLNEIDR